MANSGFTFVNAGAVLSRMAAIQNEAQAALEKTADQWEIVHNRNIKDRAPVDTGLMKERCHAEIKVVGRLKIEYKYGTDATSDKGFPYPIVVEFGHDGRNAFLYPGLNASQDEMREILQKNLGGTLSGKS